MTAADRMSDFVYIHPHQVSETELFEAGIRPTGGQLFAFKTEAEQDEMLGPEAAEAVRTGKVELADLVDRSPQKLGDDYITQKPAEDL